MVGVEGKSCLIGEPKDGGRFVYYLQKVSSMALTRKEMA
jgi:hypothetical protein